ncbi:glycoside hydrolase, partial [Schizopora paradoxa]
SDYEDIDPRYGTLADWDNLVAELHRRDMKLMMDLVVNHTSDEHVWFKESRASKTNPKSDWYIWRPPKYDADRNRLPPNNWRSHFQGSVWEWDETREEYYLHLYAAAQPDLNWENPDVRNAVWKMMRFWMDRGTDGFRMDVINLISKVPGLPDAPIVDPTQPYQQGKVFYVDGPRVHEFLKEMNREVLSKYPNRITVGEAPYTRDMHALAAYVLPSSEPGMGGRGELDMMFHFELTDIDAEGRDRANMHKPRKWKLSELKEVVGRWQGFKREKGFWNSVYLENHDNPRSVSRFGNEDYSTSGSSPNSLWRALSAKMLAMMQISLSGTLYVYQGEEIGMRNVPGKWSLEDYKDVAAKNFYSKVLKERMEQTGMSENEVDMADVLTSFQKKSRDNGRTPVQWDESLNAGFSSGEPWIRVNDDYTEWNVARQVAEGANSVLGFWKEAIRVRKMHDVLVYGDFELIDETNEKVFAFWRRLDIADWERARTALVLLNFTDEVTKIRFPIPDTVGRWALEHARLVLANYRSDESSGETSSVVLESEEGGGHYANVRLEGYEGRIYVM